LSIKKDYLTGQQTEENYELSKKNFSLCLNEYIDAHYNELTIEKKVEKKDRSRVSTASSIRVADVMACAFDGSNLALIALNNAPSPFRFQGDGDVRSLPNWWEELEDAKEWMKNYELWYFRLRKAGTG